MKLFSVAKFEYKNVEVFTHLHIDTVKTGWITESEGYAAVKLFPQDHYFRHV